ncbi:MAG: dockerin type I repeat-containing protein [Ruminococcus sp.]|nr:dockerin type I repeat-containing protein [Ruminococcus sp.]
MKKLVATLMSLSVISGVMPMCAGAVGEPIHINANPDTWTKTTYFGDVNSDGKVGIADAVALQGALLNKDFVADFDKANFDVNYDGIFDSFDLVLMRYLAINPEEAEEKTYTIDVIKSADFTEQTETLSIITDCNQLDEFLSSILSDGEEVNKYLERYNEEFFKENNLFMSPFVQKRGEGVFSEITGDAMVNVKDFEWKEDETFSFYGIMAGIASYYEEDDTGLYPITNTSMLAQIALPKSLTDGNMQTASLNVSDWFGDVYGDENIIYTSPDGKTELCITQWAFLLGGGINLYFKNPDGSYSSITNLATDDGCTPFSNEGEWFTDSEGNSVFGDRENYTITWKDDGFVIDHRVDGVWEKVSITDDGEVTDKSYYNYSYRKWREEDYEIGDYSHVYKSPDGKNTIRVTQFIDKNYDKVRLDFYFKGSDGSIQDAGLDFSDYKCGDNDKLDNYRHVYPFDQNLTEWTKDEDGNDVISNISERTGSPTFRLTWKEDSVDVEFLESQSGRWDTKTIEFK